MEKAILSKSTYIKGVQCLKLLYLYKHRNFLRDKMSADKVAIFTRGTNVGEIAQNLFPDGINCKSGGPKQYEKAIEKTIKAMESGASVLYEAAFLSQNTLIYLDILVKTEDGWDAYEVKSSVKISETYLHDAALQYLIMDKSGVKINRFALIHINPSYIRSHELNLSELFTIEDVTEICKTRKNEIEENIKKQLEILTLEHSPKIEIGKHCKEPYECDFLGHCWGENINNPIFGIPQLSFNQQFDLYQNYQEIENINFNDLDLDLITKTTIEHKQNKKQYIDCEYIKHVFGENKNIGIVKILSYKPAIPLFNNTKPYELIIYGFQVEYTKNAIKNSIIHIEKSEENPTEKTILELNKILNQQEISVGYWEDDEISKQITSDKIINIHALFLDGKIINSNLNEFNFNELYKSYFNKRPWYKKYSTDKQAGLAYEKIIHGKEVESNDQLIKDYLTDSIRYGEQLTKKIINSKC